MNVSLFITCLTDAFYPRAGIAVVKVLEHLGCRVDFPLAQTCCGQPMYNNGFQEEARDLGRRMIRVFEKSERVVTPSGSCAAMIREYYPSLFENGHEMRRAAESLAARTFEFSEFLLKVMGVDPTTLVARGKGRVTYHYSCHLRGVGVRDESERLIRAIRGLEFVPLEKAEQCCGFGGMFAMNYPVVSAEMARDKAACIASAGAERVVCNEAGCTMNIAGTCRREGVQVEFVSIAELLAESMGLMER